MARDTGFEPVRKALLALSKALENTFSERVIDTLFGYTKFKNRCNSLAVSRLQSGGQGGIRTHGTVSSSHL